MKRITLFASLALASCLTVSAQRTPTHPLDIQDAKFENLPNYLEAWLKGEMKQPQGVSEIDDQFFISRVRPLDRIKDGDYQVRPEVKRDRKMCLWTPLDDLPLSGSPSSLLLEAITSVCGHILTSTETGLHHGFVLLRV